MYLLVKCAQFFVKTGFICILNYKICMLKCTKKVKTCKIKFWFLLNFIIDFHFDNNLLIYQNVQKQKVRCKYAIWKCNLLN
jgi:hypothetical protein